MSRLQAFADGVETVLDDDSVEFRVWQINEGKHGKRRRVHWYSLGGAVVAPAQLSGRQPGDVNNPTGTRDPALWNRIEQIQCVIFGEDETTTEQLMENLFRAISSTAGDGAVEWSGYTWEVNQVARRIPMIRLNFGLRWPVTEETKQLVEIKAVNNQCEYLDPGVE